MDMDQDRRGGERGEDGSMGDMRDRLIRIEVHTGNILEELKSQARDREEMKERLSSHETRIAANESKTQRHERVLTWVNTVIMSAVLGAILVAAGVTGSGVFG